MADAPRAIERERRWERAHLKSISQEANDLRIHLRDRDAHIANLEAQLRPLLVDHGAVPETEAML